MASFIMRTLTMFLGYVYPAYECFKSIENRKTDAEEQTFWCQYWVLIAVVTFVERITDTLISWLPMYNEAKLAFIVYLWYPKTKGTNYIYTTFLKPFVTSYEPEIDRRLGELRGQAKDLTYLLWQRASLFAQSKFFELLHCLASPQIRLQAYRRHFPQLQPSLQSPENVDPAYYSQVVIREESEEIKGSLTSDSGKHEQSSLTPHKIDREPPSPSSFFKATRARQHRATYIRVP
ncbi:putative HVA22-like protein g [Selaginella moellendorffii]|nr:putative HVA22-like protein g [Selaginella moellendorffii]|eukprot:XP_002990033.2 putative HVA22-like protein g [Selaginella moellendorffii]